LLDIAAPFGRAIAQSAKAVKADSAAEGVARLAFVELDGRLPAEPRQLEPVEYKQRALDPTDFAQGECKPVLAGIGAEALEEERSTRRAGPD
jgi:hypothetical protein